MRLIFFSFLIILFQNTGISQDKIKWLSVEDVIALNKANPKKILIDVYTDWCGWCKKMDKTTFQDPEVISYINKHYYAIKFNAEQKSVVNFKDKTYQYISSGKKGYHEFAVYLLQGKLSYPSFVFLDETLETIQPLSSYIDSQKFIMISNYFALNLHKTTSWSSYAKKYRLKHGLTKS